MNKLYSFSIPGDPLLMSRARVNDRKFCDNSEEVKFLWRSHLRYYADENPLKKKPLHMDISFYFPMMSNMKQEKKLEYENKDYFQAPSVAKLLRFVFIIGESIVYESESSICSVQARKYYSENPRTDITLSSL